MSPPRLIAGNYRPLSGRSVELALGDPAVTLAPATDVLVGLARLPSTSVDSLFEHAGNRLQLINDLLNRIRLWRDSGTRTEQTVAKRLGALVDAMPRRPVVAVRPEAAKNSDWTLSYLLREWGDLPLEHLRPALDQVDLILFGDRPVTAVSQSWRLAQKVTVKAPNRVVGAHHLLAFMARHEWGISADEAWADAIALLDLTPPVPFFGRSTQAGPVSDEIKAAMFDYMAGSDTCEF